MISADEARKLQNELNTKNEETQLKEIGDKIEQVVKFKKDMLSTNKTSIYYYKKLYPTVQAELEKLGYKITYNYDQREGDLTTIKW